MNREFLNRDQKDGWGLMHHAALSGQVSVIETLRRYKGGMEGLESRTIHDVNGKENAQTPYEIARDCGYPDEFLSLLYVPM